MSAGSLLFAWLLLNQPQPVASAVTCDGFHFILRAPDLARLEGRILDIQGRGVTTSKSLLRPGVYFIERKWSSGRVVKRSGGPARR